MAVTTSKNGVFVADDDGLEYRFGCGQWARMSADDKALWTVLESTCGQPERFLYPFAASNLGGGGGAAGKIKARIPLRVIHSAGGVSTIEFYDQQPGYFLGVDPAASGPEYPVFQPLPTSIPIESFFDRLPTYPNDETAIADGLLPGNLYWLRYDTDIGLKDSLKRVSGAPAPGDLSLLEIMLNDFPAYDDNDDALSDGKVSGNLYWLSADTEVGLKDTFMRVSP
jgi:hypothetical protein